MGRKTFVWIIGALFFAASPALAGKKNSEEGTKAKVTICHTPPGNPDNQRTISVAESAVATHLAHGDVLGECGAGPVDDPADDPVVDPVVIEADAGVDFVVFEGDVVEVVGGATVVSGDYDGDFVFEWTQVGGDPVDYESTSPPLFVDTTGASGTLVFQLTVSTVDGSASASDEFTVTVESACDATIVAIGVFDGQSESRAFAINDLGQAAGRSGSVFLWDSGVMFNLGTLGGSRGEAEGINNAGLVIGRALTANGVTHAFASQGGGVLIDLHPPGQGGSSRAIKVNEFGLITGWLNTGTGITAAIWQDGSLVDSIKVDGFPVSIATSANENGGVALFGTQSLRGSWPGSRAFLFRNGILTDIGTLDGYAYTQTRGINNAGQIVGGAWAADGKLRAYLWQDGVMTDLGTLAGGYSHPEAISDSGQVVGHSDGRAFIWQDGVMTDLNSLIPADSGWVLEKVRDINENNQVAGLGLFNGQRHGFIMTLCQ